MNLPLLSRQAVVMLEGRQGEVLRSWSPKTSENLVAPGSRHKTSATAARSSSEHFLSCSALSSIVSSAMASEDAADAGPGTRLGPTADTRGTYTRTEGKPSKDTSRM